MKEGEYSAAEIPAAAVNVVDAAPVPAAAVNDVDVARQDPHSHP